ncbi:hypothetical protein ES332_D07G220700v1 [Gossypium tomentosum]|uniref:Uncharacterized protein n=1 Tax=Gossypium tomentosum TaxID=34277 RepID=A0A5D2KA83_GOSTO|nr:hypothetical protein ES332_D07G220700v1 [Gossypium tomentosum]
MARVFWGTRVIEIVKKHESGDLVWKRIKLTSTCKAKAKKRLHCVWQSIIRAEDNLETLTLFGIISC